MKYQFDENTVCELLRENEQLEYDRRELVRQKEAVEHELALTNQQIKDNLRVLIKYGGNYYHELEA